MPTKKFQAETMMEALKLVQKELGPEAIVLSSREVPLGQPWQVWRNPGIEVIAMAPDKKSQPQSQQKKAAPVVKPRPDGQGVEWQETTRQIEWVSDQNSDVPTKKPVNPYYQTETQTQTQTVSNPSVKRSSEYQNNYIERQKAAVNSSVIKRDPSEVLPADKPAVNTVPGRQMPAQQPLSTQTQQKTVGRIPEGLAQTQLRLIAQGVDQGLVDRLVQTTFNSLQPSHVSR